MPPPNDEEAAGMVLCISSGVTGALGVGGGVCGPLNDPNDPPSDPPPALALCARGWSCGLCGAIGDASNAGSEEVAAAEAARTGPSAA
jgi:hypothetical protein